MMMIMRRRLACCSRDRVPSLDMDEPEKIMTYNGLESFILDSQPYENESHSSRGDGCPTDSLDEDASSCSSSKDVFGSFSSKWLTLNTKKDEHGLNEWEISESPQHYYVKEKPGYSLQCTDVEVMKERFSKLLLGEDVTGGKKGLSSALALSNAITNLAVSVFGELWKLEPLSEERKVKWQREMDWLLSPTKYMVELVPTRQSSANGQTLEIMTPKARADIHMNLPALQKLDSMLIETLDSMVDKEFWYAEGGSRAEGRTRSMSQSRRWWLPSPQVPKTGLSDSERKKLLHQAKVVHQVFKAAKSINENVLMEMPVPTGIRDALAKPGKASLGEELYRVLTSETSSAEMLSSLNLKSEHAALEAINRLESAVLSWKERINEQVSGKTPVKTSWSFIRDSMSELDHMECIQYRAEALLQQLKTRYPNLPQSFLEVAKIQYGKDIGHSILEAYSRVLGNLASSILGRMRDILQEDIVSNPNSPIPTTSCFPGIALTGMAETPSPSLRIRHSLIDQMNMVDGRFGHPVAARTSLDCEASISDSRRSSVMATPSRVMATPSRSRVWCIGREACGGLTPRNSP